MEEKKVISRLSAIGILGNIVLVTFKMYAGIVGKSNAMISDAIHSLSDVFATIIAALGVLVSKKKPDKLHPYGHDRFECLASLILGLILLATGVGIGWSGVKTIALKQISKIEIPSAIALIAAIVSIVTKEGMFRYTRYWAKKLNSSAFMADAWHHRSDAFSSVGSLIGIAGAMIGYPVMDCIASIIISLCILKVGFDIVREAVSNMLDTSCGEEYENELKSFISAQKGVESVDLLLTRKFGNKIYIEAEISVKATLSLEQAHSISENVHNAVEERSKEIKHIMIHVNPSNPVTN